MINDAPACVMNYTKGSINRSSKEDSLILTLGTDTSEYQYLALLDYANGKSYLAKTGLLVSDYAQQLNCCDLTGDGVNEFVLSGIANDWLEWQAYRFVDGNIKELSAKYSEKEGEVSYEYFRNIDSQQGIQQIQCKEVRK